MKKSNLLNKYLVVICLFVFSLALPVFADTTQNNTDWLTTSPVLGAKVVTPTGQTQNVPPNPTIINNQNMSQFNVTQEQINATTQSAAAQTQNATIVPASTPGVQNQPVQTTNNNPTNTAVVNGGQPAASQPDSSDTYTLLEPLPCIPSPASTDASGRSVPAVSCGSTGSMITSINVSDYVRYMFNLLIAVSAVMAIFMIVLGGFEYMTTDAVDGKSEGLKKVQNAVYGLLMVLGSYLILRTINPELVNIPSTLVAPLAPAATTPSVPTAQALPSTPVLQNVVQSPLTPSANPTNLNPNGSQ